MAIQKSFVIRNGLEVNTNLIVANADADRVGIGTSIAQHVLHVNGGIGATNSIITGISTISVLNVGTAGTVITGTLSGSVGIGTTNPQYKLQVIGGIGVTHAYISGITTVVDELRVGIGGTVLTVLGIDGYVGIGTTNPTFLLDVQSPVSTGQTALYIHGDVRVTGDLNIDDISITNLNVSGISTFVGTTIVNDIDINGLLTAGSSTGGYGSYLRHTGTGVTWAQVQQSVVETDTQTATEGQLVFNTNYEPTLVDVYLNGIRLSAGEFTATNGTSITLTDFAYAGDTLNFVSYNPFNEYPSTFWKSGIGDEIYYSMGNVGIGTTNPNEKLQVGSGETSSFVVTGIGSVGIGTTNPKSKLDVNGTVLANGFISIANTTPIQISLVGNKVIFAASGIGSTSFTLF